MEEAINKTNKKYKTFTKNYNQLLIYNRTLEVVICAF